MSSVGTELTNSGNGVDLIPDEVDFTNADIDRALARPRLRGGEWYWGKITSVRKDVWKTGSLYLDMTVNPMDTSGKTRGPSTRYKLTVPFANPNKADHKIPNTIGFCHDFLNAQYPQEFPRYPRFNKADGTFVCDDGQVVDKPTAKAMERDITRKVLQRIKECWSNPATLVGEVGFVLIEDNQYRNVKEFATEAPPGINARYTDFADTSL